MGNIFKLLRVTRESAEILTHNGQDLPHGGLLAGIEPIDQPVHGAGSFGFINRFRNAVGVGEKHDAPYKSASHPASHSDALTEGFKMHYSIDRRQKKYR